MKAVLRKRREKLLRRQQRVLHEVAGVYGHEYLDVLANCAVAMRRAGLEPDPRLEEAVVRSVTES